MGDSLQNKLSASILLKNEDTLDNSDVVKLRKFAELMVHAITYSYYIHRGLKSKAD